MQTKDKEMTLKEARKIINDCIAYEDGQLEFSFMNEDIEIISIKTKEDKDWVVNTACTTAHKDVKRVLKLNSKTADNNSKQINKNFIAIDDIDQKIKELKELKNQKIKDIALLMLANKDIINYIIELATPCIQEKNRQDIEKVEIRIDKFKNAKHPEMVKLTSQEESDLKEFIELHKDIIESTGFKGLIEYIDKEISISLNMQHSKLKFSQYKLTREIITANCLIH